MKAEKQCKAASLTWSTIFFSARLHSNSFEDERFIGNRSQCCVIKWLRQKTVSLSQKLCGKHFIECSCEPVSRCRSLVPRSTLWSSEPMKTTHFHAVNLCPLNSRHISINLWSFQFSFLRMGRGCVLTCLLLILTLDIWQDWQPTRQDKPNISHPLHCAYMMMLLLPTDTSNWVR